MAYFVAGPYDEAHGAADKTLNVIPKYPQGLRLKVATCGVLNRIEEGRIYVQRLLAVHPECSITWLRDFWEPLLQRIPGALENYIQGARRAGLPE